MIFKSFIFFLLVSITTVYCEHLIMGDVNNRQLIYHTTAQYDAFPFMKRVKTVFYSNTEQKVIKSILVYDNMYSKATASITAGGIGYTYVNLRLKSERGRGLDYDIGLYS
ncbi:uncharacterized protein ACR2FA_011880 [Aphomia sociella]